MKRFVAIVLALMLLSACGGGDDKKQPSAQGDSATTTTAAGGGTTPATTKDGKPVDPKAASPGGGPTTTASGAQPGGTTGTTAVPVTAELARACVRRGASGDAQKLTVKTTPGDTIGYSTSYEGNRNEMTDPHWKSGSGYGKADATGTYVAEWKLPEDVPTGTATLQFIAQGKIQPSKTFKVVSQLESC